MALPPWPQQFVSATISHSHLLNASCLKGLDGIVSKPLGLLTGLLQVRESEKLQKVRLVQKRRDREKEAWKP